MRKLSKRAASRICDVAFNTVLQQGSAELALTPRLLGLQRSAVADRATAFGEKRILESVERFRQAVKGVPPCP